MQDLGCAGPQAGRALEPLVITSAPQKQCQAPVPEGRTTGRTEAAT